jgi:hypothetical protein
MSDALHMEVLTRNADVDDVSEETYREMYDELRAGHSLDGLVVLMQSSTSKASWSRYERGVGLLTRAMQNDLRRAVGYAPRPVTVEAAVSDVDPNAEVLRVSNGATAPAHRVVLIATSAPVTLRSAQRLEVLDGAATRPVGRVQRRTRAVRGISVQPEVAARLDALRTKGEKQGESRMGVG